ncbi:MAG: NAD-dependent protein deacylase [Lachnospiraceae bacterium]|nr:NAD-dependent protein deacylase [Lachnospiraceae bacterium]
MSKITENIAKLQDIIDVSKRIVFFGGAGVSTESGIPDFRSVDGLYHQKYDYPPETILSHGFFMSKTEEFYKFYSEKILMKGVENRPGPNAAHLKLAELEEKGKLTAVVTQNIDGLHQEAGSQTVYELHGSVLRNYCMDCGASFDLDYMLESETIVPHCDKCGGVIKPDVVLYGEGLDPDTMSGAINAIKEADTLIIGGTSLVVYPAAGMVDYFKGNYIVLINKGATSHDGMADLLISDSIGEVLGAINVK